MKKIVITHTDLDGIVSAVLVIRHLGSYDRLYLTQPHKLSKVLNRIPNGSLVYITDLGINPYIIDEVINHIKRIIGHGGKVYWFDHHVWEDEWISKMKEVGVNIYVDRSTCGAGVVYKYLGVRGKGVEELVRAACSVDLWRFDYWLGNFLSRVVGYKGGSRWKEQVINMLLRFEGSLDKEILGIVEKQIDKELKIFSKVLRKSGVIVHKGIKIAYYFKNNEEHLTSYIAHLIMSRCGADMAIICRRGSVSLRSRGMDVRRIALSMGGGGHPKAAGAPLKPPLILKLLTLLKITRPQLRWCIDQVIKHI